MPVEVINFNGTAGENGQVKLGWQTALENNLFGFYVQRSQDAESWQDQAFVAAKGLSQYGMTYHFIDPTPLEGKSWYRLRQVDLQGNETLSSTIEISQSTPEFIDNIDALSQSVQQRNEVGFHPLAGEIPDIQGFKPRRGNGQAVVRRNA
jgi:hypothetical protein